jgi:hypothetical protein
MQVQEVSFSSLAIPQYINISGANIQWKIGGNFFHLSAGLDYIAASRVLVFSGDSVQNVSVQIISDGILESSEIFFGLLSSADGMAIPSNVHLQPTRATATIINDNSTNIAVNLIVFTLCHQT